MARALSLAATLVLVLTVTAVSFGSAHHGCTSPGPPVLRPDPGTPRAGLCGAIGGDYPWLLLAPVAVLALAAWPLRTAERTWLAFAGTLAVALVTVAILANSLTFAYTI